MTAEAIQNTGTAKNDVRHSLRTRASRGPPGQPGRFRRGMARGGHGRDGQRLRPRTECPGGERTDRRDGRRAARRLRLHRSVHRRQGHRRRDHRRVDGAACGRDRPDADRSERDPQGRHRGHQRSDAGQAAGRRQDTQHRRDHDGHAEDARQAYSGEPGALHQRQGQPAAGGLRGRRGCTSRILRGGNHFGRRAVCAAGGVGAADRQPGERRRPTDPVRAGRGDRARSRHARYHRLRRDHLGVRHRAGLRRR